MITKQQYETMFVTVNENRLDDPNHYTAIADMTGYIERMGGTTPEEALSEGQVRYEWIIPSHWAGRLYERFRSFGLHAKVKPDSMWFGLLCKICDENDECTSTDPSNHQGDTCPVHEN